MRNINYFLSFFSGTSPQAFDPSNYVEIHSWPQSDRNVAGHVSMTIVHKGQAFHVSFWHQRDYNKCENDPLKKKWEGYPPFWVDSLEDDCLIEGFRHEQKENPKQNGFEILDAIKSGKSKPQPLKPEKTIRLNTLDTQVMHDTLQAYKQSNPQWGPFSGTWLHTKGTYNCASITLHLLQVGGIEKVACSYSQNWRDLALATTLLASPFFSLSILSGAYCLGIAWAGGSVAGGCADGLEDIQNIQRVIDIQKGKSIGRRAGLNVLALLISGFGSIVIPHPIAKLLTLPDQVMSVVESAAKYERQCYTPTHSSSQAEPAFSNR